jgi:hypothetical protein
VRWAAQNVTEIFILAFTAAEMMLAGFCIFVPLHELFAALAALHFNLGATQELKTAIAAHLWFVRLVLTLGPKIRPCPLVNVSTVLASNTDLAAFAASKTSGAMLTTKP